MQEAQQSAEGQHSIVALAAPAKPSAITANNRVALMNFIFFLLGIIAVLIGADRLHRRGFLQTFEVFRVLDA
jgi:hypothetical protein